MFSEACVIQFTGGQGRPPSTSLEVDPSGGGRPPPPFWRPADAPGARPPRRQTPLEADQLGLTYLSFIGWNFMALVDPAHGIATKTVRRVGWWVGRVGLLGLGCPSKSRNLYFPLP